jgi:hypothetical protein
MPGAAVLSLVTHLVILRRDDLLDALEVCNDCDESDPPLIDELFQRRQDRDQALEARQRAPRKKETAPRAPRLSPADREGAWAAALAAPAAALAQCRAVAAELTGAALRRAQSRLVGLDPSMPGGVVAPLQDRLLHLAALVEQPEQEASETATKPVEPAPKSEPETEPDLAQLLHQEAMADTGDNWPRLAESLQQWQALADPHRDWRSWWRHSSMFVGHDGIGQVAAAVGAGWAEVAEHVGDMARREMEQRREVAAAWPTAEGLLADAVLAEGWCWLAAASGVAPGLVIGHYKAMVGRG